MVLKLSSLTMASMLSNETYSQPQQIRGEPPTMALTTVTIEEPKSSLQSLVAMASLSKNITGEISFKYISNIFKADRPITRPSVITPCRPSHSLNSSLSSSTSSSPTMSHATNSKSIMSSVEITPSNSASNPSSSSRNLDNSSSNLDSSSSSNLNSSHSNMNKSPSNMDSSLDDSSSKLNSSPRHLSSPPSNMDSPPSNMESSPSNLNQAYNLYNPTSPHRSMNSSHDILSSSPNMNCTSPSSSPSMNSASPSSSPNMNSTSTSSSPRMNSTSPCSPPTMNSTSPSSSPGKDSTSSSNSPSMNSTSHRSSPNMSSTSPSSSPYMISTSPSSSPSTNSTFPSSPPNINSTSPSSPPNMISTPPSSPPNMISTPPSSSPNTNNTSPSSSPSHQTFSENLSSALSELGTQERSREMQTSKPCTVCGEPTRGIYYGAVTCLPCKTFFVRYNGETRTMKCRTGQRNCDINEATRVSCKACRYAKCVSAGMRRKERPEKQLPLRGEPICAVCGDSANGLHFGVFTCEGCKKFFRRGLEEHITYKCKHSLACRMNPRTRNLCRLCRFQRCVEVGMSLEGIRFGRRKKQRDVESTSTCSSSSDTDMADLPNSHHGLPFQSLPLSPTSPMDLSPAHHRPGSTSDGASSCSSPRSSPVLEETSQKGVPHDFFPCRGPAEVQPIQHLEQCNYDNTKTQRVCGQTERGNYGYGGDVPTTAYPLRLREAIEKVREGNICAGPSGDMNRTWDHRPQPEVIQYWQRSVPLEVDSMTPEQRHLISTTLSLYEPQKLRFTLDPASNTVTTLPGLVALGNGNVDDEAIQNITNFVIFAKSLPGFDRIHRADQYTLIRLGSTETRILSSAVFDDRSLDSQLEEAYRQQNTVHFKFLKTTLSISKTVRLLNLDNIESCLLFVLCLIAADRPGLHDGDVVEAVRQKYIAAMASYVEDNHGDAFSRLSAIFSVMPRVRQMGRWYCELTNNIHFAFPENRPSPEQLYTTV